MQLCFLKTGLPGSLWQAEVEDGGTSNGRIVSHSGTVGRDDDVDGADEVRGDGGGVGTVKRSKLGVEAGEECSVEW